MLWPERVRDRYTRNMELYFATEHPLRFTIRADGLRRDGTEFVGEMSWGIVETEAGPLLLAIGRDMTVHREAMARLQRQSRQQAAVAALGERALSGADVGDLAAEAVERMRETLALRTWVAARGRGARRRGARTAASMTRSRSHRRRGVRRDRRREGALGEDEESFLRAIANVLATALGRLRGEERMRHEALHDPLTGLANRALCRERLIHALARTGRDEGVGVRAVHRPRRLQGRQRPLRPRGGRRAADRAGAPAGGTVRPADTVARLGGDEFVVVCEDIDEHTAIALGDRLTEAIHEPLDVDGIEHRLSASIGIALGAAGRRDPDALLADADAAAYRAKAEGRGRVEVFDTAPAPARARAPADGRGAGASAVARPVAARVPADRLARGPVGDRARGAAALGLPGRRDERAGGLHPGRRGVGADRRDRGVDADAGLPRERGGVRARARTARRSGSTSRRASSPSRTFRRWSRTAWARAGCRPDGCGWSSRSACCRERRRRRGRTSRRCASSGVGLALDDFGTGYSSLRDLPVRAVKIDRSFVAALGRSPGDTAIVAAIISLASALGIAAIAEGVENEEQADAAGALGCPYAQGYLFGAPGPRITSEP